MDRKNTDFVAGVLLNGRYETVSALNRGSFGMVSMAKDHLEDRFVALKCLGKPSAGLELHPGIKVDDRSEELDLHSRLGNHPSIVKFLDSFDTDTNCYLVLEYCFQGDLYEAIRQDKGPKQTDHVRSFMLQLIDAVEYIHSKGIFHRDIKPENIFLTESGDMKLGDFGLATMETWSYEIAVGSDRYMAPEQFDPQGNGLSPARADIWSLGICLLNILFSRNPFAEPALSDPLYEDFARDRQSLFDVFPNMHQDTFNVLLHCMSVDPEKRSLALMRDALDRVVSFTTDDESLDDFCTEDRDVVAATANREPLRTPSAASPNMDQGQPFPWAQALHMTPQKHQHVHSLATIHGNESYTEDLFPASEASMPDWVSRTDTRSVESIVDSGLGLSIGSPQHGTSAAFGSRSRAVPIAGSLPATRGTGTSKFASLFSSKKKTTFESKSWSDLWDEEQEEHEQEERERTINAGHHLRVNQLSQADSDSDGRATPRAYLAEINKNPSVRPPSRTSVKSKDDGPVSQHTGFVFEEEQTATPTGRYSPPAKRSFIKDKWSALGERRRGLANSVKESSPFESGKKRFSSANLRRNFNEHRRVKGQNQRVDRGNEIWMQQQWNQSTDWRRSDNHLPAMRPSPLHTSQLDGNGSDDSLVGGFDEFAVDIGDDDEAEWVGGFAMHDLHL